MLLLSLVVPRKSALSLLSTFHKHFMIIHWIISRVFNCALERRSREKLLYATLSWNWKNASVFCYYFPMLFEPISAYTLCTCNIITFQNSAFVYLHFCSSEKPMSWPINWSFYIVYNIYIYCEYCTFLPKAWTKSFKQNSLTGRASWNFIYF